MKVLRINEVAERFRVSRTTIYRWLKESDFPRSFPLGDRTVVWDEADLEKWLQQKKEMRNERSNRTDEGVPVGVDV